MDDLTTLLKALLHHYAAAFDQPPDGRLGEQFRRDMQLLVSEYGVMAVSSALDEIPDEPWPSASLH
jgi:hypothetical protein